MGIAYQIKCRHCGAKFNFGQVQSMDAMPRCVGYESYVETESPIRCPACYKRTGTDFPDQKSFAAKIIETVGNRHDRS